MSTPFFLVAGFLGSGKTSLLKHLLQSGWASHRIAIIQNEFAQANVDAEILKQAKAYHVTEINGGSVFCVCLLSHFRNSLAEIVDHIRPEMVILEATGLADPIAIGQLLGAAELKQRLYLSRILSVVDASNFLEMQELLPRIRQQVRVADFVVVNKMDLSDKATAEKIRGKIAELNPFANILQTTHCRGLDPDILGTRPDTPVAVRQASRLQEFEPGGRPAIESAVIKTTETIPQEGLGIFLSEFAAKTYRMKGFAKLRGGNVVAIQCCFGGVELFPCENYEGPSVIVGLGPRLDASEFRKRFDELC